MNQIDPAPTRTPALETDKSGIFNRVWSRWFNDIYNFLKSLTATVGGLPSTVEDTASLHLEVNSNVISGAVLPAGVNHAQLDNINSAGYTHLTSADATDLTDGGTTSLHSHADDHVRIHDLDSTLDHSIGSLTSGYIVKSDGTKLVNSSHITENAGAVGIDVATLGAWKFQVDGTGGTTLFLINGDGSNPTSTTRIAQIGNGTGREFQVLANGNVYITNLTAGLVESSAAGLLSICATSVADVASAVSLKHSRQHALDSGSDHTIGGLTSTYLVKSDGSTLVSATNTDTEVAVAVSASHTQNTDSQLIASDGTPNPAISCDAAGLVTVDTGNLIIDQPSDSSATAPILTFSRQDTIRYKVAVGLQGDGQEDFCIADPSDAAYIKIKRVSGNIALGAIAAPAGITHTFKDLSQICANVGNSTVNYPGPTSYFTRNTTYPAMHREDAGLLTDDTDFRIIGFPDLIEYGAKVVHGFGKIIAYNGAGIVNEYANFSFNNGMVTLHNYTDGFVTVNVCPSTQKICLYGVGGDSITAPTLDIINRWGRDLHIGYEITFWINDYEAPD